MIAQIHQRFSPIRMSNQNTDLVLSWRALCKYNSADTGCYVLDGSSQVQVDEGALHIACQETICRICMVIYGARYSHTTIVLTH